MDNPLNIFGGLAGLGVLAAGIGFAYSQFKSGANQAKDDLIKTLKETALVEREKSSRLVEEKLTLIKSHQEQINELSKQLGILQGKSEANEKKMKEYIEILQGRSPEQNKFIEYMTLAAENSAKYMQESAIILVQVRTFMESMNKGIAVGNTFNQEVADATSKHEGEPLRKRN